MLLSKIFWVTNFFHYLVCNNLPKITYVHTLATVTHANTGVLRVCCYLRLFQEHISSSVECEGVLDGIVSEISAIFSIDTGDIKLKGDIIGVLRDQTIGRKYQGKIKL